MSVNLQLSGRTKLMAGGALLLVLLLALSVFALRSMRTKEPTLEEIRHTQLLSMVKMLDAYYKRHGVYPQPTARNETIEGFQHVWGYRPNEPASASCTIVQGEDELPDLLSTSCGGNIFDARGRVIGWKGTLTTASAMNSVDIAVKGAGLITAPLSDFAQSVPPDPAYGSHDLRKNGVGEYVYAVRAPDDGAQGKGGVQYQLATVFREPKTNALTTEIRGDYFVRSDEKDLLPPSLIGPGLLLDRFRNPLPGQEVPLHVLLNGQQEGYPSPLLGKGETIIELLTIRRQAMMLREMVDERMGVLSMLPESGATQAFLVALKSVQDEISQFIFELNEAVSASSPVLTERKASVVVTEQTDANAFVTRLHALAKSTQDVCADFLQEKAEEVRTTLQTQLKERWKIMEVLSGALLVVREAESSILLGRDELIRYLSSLGIEEQSRNRAGRQLQFAVEEITKLSELFAERKIAFTDPFLSESMQEELMNIAPKSSVDKDEREGSLLSGSGTQSSGEEPVKESSTGSQVNSTMSLTGSFVMLTTLASEVQTLEQDLFILLEEIQADLQNLSVDIQDIDEKLRRLTRVLTGELIRIDGLFSELASEEVMSQLSLQYEQILSGGDVAEALQFAAEFSRQHGNFSPFLFFSESLDVVVLERQPGIPDLSLYKNPLEAQYTGIPYPLP